MYVESEDAMNKWGENILGLGEAAGYDSQAKLARAIDVKPTTFYKWFLGERDPDVPHLALWRLSDVLNVSLFDIQPDRVQNDDCFQRVLDAVLKDDKSLPVDQSVREAIDRALRILAATLHELEEIRAKVRGE